MDNGFTTAGKSGKTSKAKQPKPAEIEALVVIVSCCLRGSGCLRRCRSVSLRQGSTGNSNHDCSGYAGDPKFIHEHLLNSEY
jgi:hypothetical protein